MPRRNTATHGRRRAAKALPAEGSTAAVSLEELALELVRRGRASEAILDHRNTPSTTNRKARP